MDIFGKLDVGLGENCDCRCGFLYASILRGWHTSKLCKTDLFIKNRVRVDIQ